MTSKNINIIIVILTIASALVFGGLYALCSLWFPWQYVLPVTIGLYIVETLMLCIWGSIMRANLETIEKMDKNPLGHHFMRRRSYE